MATQFDSGCCFSFLAPCIHSWKACEGGYCARTLALDDLHPLPQSGIHISLSRNLNSMHTPIIFVRLISECGIDYWKTILLWRIEFFTLYDREWVICA
jgi:hypothetical protein